MKSLIVCLVLFAAFVNVACPKKDAIREAAKASYRLPAATNDLIDRVKAGVANGVITPAQARAIGGILDPVATAELALVRLVRAADAIYRKTGTIPADQMARIKILFDSQIVTPFLKLLEMTKLLSPDASAMLGTAIAGVRLFLSTIGGGFGSSLMNLITDSRDLNAGGGVTVAAIQNLNWECA